MKRMNGVCALLILTVVLAGCEGGEGDPLATNPFVGGSEGLAISFESGSPPAETFDGGSAPFDVIVQIENKGEELVKKDNVQVKITGIRSADFSTSDAALTKNAPDDLVQVQIDGAQKVIPGPPTYVEFTELNHRQRIAGQSLSYPIRADICYLYKTTAAGKLCVRENVLNPLPGGICEITGAKTLYNSGAPLQVASLSEQARAKDKIGFTFDITHPGTGTFYEKGSSCDQIERKSAGKVFVRVETRIPGLSCTGLTQASEGAVEGYITIYEGSRGVACTQQLPALRDYELPVKIELVYDYLQNVQTSILVKSSGE